MTFAKRLYILRTCRNLTQKQLAEKTGITENTILGYEKGYHDPPAVMICALADFFKVSTDYLLGRSDAPK